MITAEESPELADKRIDVEAKRYIEYFHGMIGRWLENVLENTWRIVSIEERSELLCEAMPSTRADDAPNYLLQQILATFDITAIENGPLERIEDDRTIAIPRRKLRCKAELADDGSLKIVECDVDAPRRSGL